MNLEITVVQLGARGRGRNYFFPVEVRLYDIDVQETEYAKSGRGPKVKVIRSWCCNNTKHTGPRSEYGKALREAEAMRKELTNPGRSE